MPVECALAPGGQSTFTYVELVDRLVVVGGPGSGKSTLARQAAVALSAAHVELDSLWWQADWVHLETTEFTLRVSDLLGRTPRWVVDGNYVDEVASVVWPLADTLVWLDVRRTTAFRRAVLRSARRLLARQELWNGNRERLAVLSPMSLARLWSRWPSYTTRIRTELDQTQNSNLSVIHLESSKEVRSWLEGLSCRS